MDENAHACGHGLSLSLCNFVCLTVMAYGFYHQSACNVIFSYFPPKFKYCVSVTSQVLMLLVCIDNIDILFISIALIMFSWDNTKAALQDLQEVLVCKKW
jgi:hypothetical protein